MPKLSDTMEEGTVLKWLVADGSVVTRGQPIVEIETDKADMTVEAPGDGPLSILAAEGAVLAVGAPIARIGADTGVAATPTPPEPPAPAVEDEVTTNIPVGDDGTPDQIAMPVAPAAPATPAPAPAPAAGSHPDGSRIIASPLARQVARDAGIDLAGVHGTGPAAASSAPTSTPQWAVRRPPCRRRHRLPPLLRPRRPVPRRPRPPPWRSVSGSRPAACSARSPAACATRWTPPPISRCSATSTHPS